MSNQPERSSRDCSRGAGRAGRGQRHKSHGRTWFQEDRTVFQVLVSAWNCNASMNFICKCAKDIKVFLALTMDKHKVRSQLIPN